MSKSDWIPTEVKLPKNDEYVLVSFANFSIPDIGRYAEDEDGGGTFFPGDSEQSFSQYDLFVNAWMPLPECYEDLPTSKKESPANEREEFSKRFNFYFSKVKYNLVDLDWNISAIEIIKDLSEKEREILKDLELVKPLINKYTSRKYLNEE